MKAILSIIWLLIIIYVVVFTILNSKIIELNFFFSTVKIYLPLLLLLNLVIGAILGILAMLPLILRTRYGRCGGHHDAD